eukprot:Pgem_evm1s10946
MIHVMFYSVVYRLELNSLAPVIRRKSVDDTAWATADGEREHITSEKEACVSPAQSAFKNADERAIAIQELSLWFKYFEELKTYKNYLYMEATKFSVLCSFYNIIYIQ